MTVSFDDVQYGFRPSPCSPRFVDAEPHGIKVAIPSKFNLSAKAPGGGPAMLPLCLTLRFNARYLSRFEYVFQDVRVVLVDDERGETFICGVWRNRHYLPKPPSRIPPEELEKCIDTKYNTVNLLEFINLPHHKATYRLYALLEEHRSNVATIQIEVDEP